MNSISAQHDEARLLADTFLSLVEHGVWPPPSATQAHERIAAAAWTLHEVGVHFHKLLLLQEVMDKFVVAGAAGDPHPIFFETLAGLTMNGHPKIKACRCYHAALALAPTQAETLYNLSTLESRDGRWDEALSALDRVIALGPSKQSPPNMHLRANAHWNRAASLDRLGRHDDATRAFTAALELLDNFGVDHRIWADWLRQDGYSPEAMEHYHRIMAYSHRYAAEFILPELKPDERPPRDASGSPLDPFAINPIACTADGGRIIYHAMLYFRVPARMIASDPAALVAAAHTSRPSVDKHRGVFRWLLGRRMSPPTDSVTCAFTETALRATYGPLP